MNIDIVTPAPTHSRVGNRVTALNYARHLRGLGHRVHLEESYEDRSCDLLIALHARRSHPSIRRFRDRHPDLPLVLTMTGTDLYRDIRTDKNAKESLELADRIIVLQAMGREELPEHLRHKARVIVQSIKPPPGSYLPKEGVFEVCVLGHMRPEKDPFRAAEASRLLCPSSRVRVTHVGKALSPEMEKKALKEVAENPRYRWVGEVPRWKGLRLLSRSRIHVLSSLMEGGANALCEAIACSVPTLASRIKGSIGLLGEDYPGYFPVGDTQALASLIKRTEGEPDFCRKLREWSDRLKPMVTPEAEQRSLKELIEEFS